jgi:hypothetical protein
MNRGKKRRTLTLKIGSVYHAINSTSIHVRANDLNIYMYRTRNI